MKGPSVPPWTMRALFPVIVSLFILTEPVAGQGTPEIAPLSSGPSVRTSTPDAVSQAACTYAISPTSHSVSASEETGSILITAAENCGWTARSGAPWISIGQGASGSGNGMVTYSVSANQAAVRTGMIAIAGQVFQLSQAAGSLPQYTLTMSRGGNGQGKVSSNPSGNVFKKGTWVVLQAFADGNSVFSGWNGACSGNSTSCNLQMMSDRTVTATFFLKTYTIRVPAPINGVIHPSGTIKVTHGEKRRFQVIPLPGYRVLEVLVDKTSVGAVNLYTFDNLSADHVLEAIFVKQ